VDTRDHALTKLTRLHDESHPTLSPTNKPTRELLTPGGEHHGIGDGDRLVMTKDEDPLSGAPNGLQICPPEEEQELAAAPSREM
jgi:hypothetical protein